MTKENFILLSLKEEESKKLAQIISNDTSRKILDALSEKESTESDLARRLGIPISTVHYNLQALVKGKLVEADEYHYSKKGKEILHYKLANKYVIIAPKSTFGIKEKLRKILPVGIFALLGTFGIYLFDMQETVFRGSGVKEAAMDTAPRMLQATSKEAISEPLFSVLMTEPAVWFLTGCIFTLILIVLVEYMIYKRGGKR